MKMWEKRDEWTQHAPCRDSLDHTIPPVRGEEDADRPVADPSRVRRICDSCPVRPECIEWAVGSDQPIDVWSAGRYIPADKRGAKRVRGELAQSLPAEREARGEF